MTPLPCDATALVQCLFAESPDPLFLVALDSGRLFDVNAAALRLAGSARDAVLQQTLGTLIRAQCTDAPFQPCAALAQPDAWHDRDDHVFVRPDGTRTPIRLSLTPVKAAAAPLGVLRLRDRPERADDVEQRLRASESKFRNLVETSKDLIWSIDAAGYFTYVNRKAALAILGREPDEMIGRHFQEFVAPDHVARDLDTHQALRQEVLEQYETVLFHKDGSRIDIRINSVPVADELGNFVGNTGTASDITRWKNAETALLESQQRFETFMDSLPLVGFMKDADGRMVYINKEFQVRFGLPATHFLGKLDHELWPKEIADALRAADRRVLADTERVEMRECVPTPDGILRDWWVVKFPFRDPHGGLYLGGIALDLTERKQLEEALRLSEERYRQHWQRNLAGCVRASLDGRILDCNDSFARMFGYGSREEMLTRRTQDLYFDLGVRTEFVTRLRANQFLTNYELQMRRADGSTVWILENVALLQEHGEEILEGTLIDITERKRIEEALRASEANYRTLIGHLDQAIFLKDRALRYITVNPVFCAAVGKTQKQLYGHTIGELFPNNSLAEKSSTIEMQVLTEGKAIETEDVLTIEGRPRNVRISRTPVKNDDGAVVGVLGICWDVTEQRSVETQLRHMQKMDAIGQLAGGIAHDFNNLLTIMLGNLSYVLTQNSDWASAVELIRNAEKAGLRAAELTQSLLGFSHRAALATVPCNLNQAVDEVLRLTRSTLPAEILTEVHAARNLWLVQADPGQMHQVLTNLTLNARDAMPQGGKIVFQTSHFVPDAEYLSSNLEARPGEYVRLRVADTGQGIPLEVKQRIFEPFFTTKEKGKGTGLGLAIVFGIVHQHGGWIVCESVPNQGAAFDVFLPRCPSIPVQTAEPTPTPADTPTADTILIVDDEAMIRQLAKTILTRAGYSVLTAENGKVALDVLEQHNGQISVMVLDAVMPCMSGRETLRELSKHASDVNVILSSGYSTELMGLHEFPQIRAFLPKPYRAEQLIQTVTEILGQTRRGSTQS